MSDVTKNGLRKLLRAPFDRLRQQAGGSPERWGLPKGAVGAFLTIAAVLVGVYVYVWAPEQLLYTVNVALYTSIGALGLNLLTGYAGQVSIGNAAFLAIGAYSVVIADGLPFPIPILFAIVFSGLVGLLIGIPSLRLQGLYLVFSTLALHYLVVYAFDHYDSRTGAIGGHFVGAPNLGFMVLDSSREWFVVLLVVVACTTLFVRNIVQGRPGRAADALRHSEDAAAVMGVNVSLEKLRAFTVSSAIVGMGGAIGAYFLQAVSIGYFSLGLAVSYIAMILIGGLRSLAGSILGAFTVAMIPFILSQIASSMSSETGGFLAQNLSSVQSIMFGLAILLFLYFRPGGIASLLARSRSAGVGNTDKAGMGS